MNSKERLELIRKNALVWRGVRPVETVPIRKPRGTEATGRPFRNRIELALGHQAKEMSAKWVTVADEPAETLTPKPLRKHKASPLTILAEKYPVRLPRRAAP